MSAGPCACPSHTEHCLSEARAGAQSGSVAWRRDGRPGTEAWGAPGGLRRLSASLLPSHREAGHAGWGPQCTPRPRPCPSPGSSSLFLSSSAQEPGRKAQNTELQEAAGEVEEPGQLTAVCSLMPSFPGPRSPAPSPRPDPKFLPSAIPLRVLSSPTRGLQQPPPACGEH